jgi:hypothetical protein
MKSLAAGQSPKAIAFGDPSRMGPTVSRDAPHHSAPTRRPCAPWTLPEGIVKLAAGRVA